MSANTVKAFDVDDLQIERDEEGNIVNGTVTITVSRAVLPLISSMLVNCPEPDRDNCSRAYIAVRALGTACKVALNLLYGNWPLETSQWDVFDMADHNQLVQAGKRRKA